MKESRHSTAFLRAIFAIAFVLMSLSPFGESLAQPTNYCITYPNPNFTYSYCYPYVCTVVEVKLEEVGGGVVIDRTSTYTQGNTGESGSSDGCFIFTGVEGKLKLGKSYKLTVRTEAYSSYMCHVRVFIDWNHNGSFADAGEYIGIGPSQYGSSSPYGTTSTLNFVVPNNVEGATRMRVIGEYDYYNAGTNACQVGYAYSPYNYHYGNTEDYILSFVPNIESTWPNTGDILLVNNEYGATTATTQRPSATMGATQASGAILTYKISGPKPSTTTIYEGLDLANSPYMDMGGYKTYYIKKARGTSGNYMNYTTVGDEHASVTFTRGGEYTVAASIGGNVFPGEVYNNFTASHNYDMAVTDASSPKNNSAPRYFKYLRGQTIKVTGVFQNVGLNDVSDFWAYAYITNMQGDTVYRGQYHFDSYNNPADQILKPSNKKEIDFQTVKFNNVSTYKLYFNVNYAPYDMESYNDVFPRSDAPAYIFEIAYEIQVASNRFIFPTQGQVLIGNRPFIPIGEFINRGVGDASDVPAKLNIYKLPRTGQPPFKTQNRIVQDVPAGKYNLKVEEFDPEILTETGSYEAELIITHVDDVVRSDDTTRIQFTVNGGLNGTYTCGTTYGGSPTNFPTIDSLMNTLFYRGLAGPTTIEFTDDTYNVVGTKVNGPAWDFSTYIISLGYDASTKKLMYPLTFKPSTARSLTRGAITINLYSPNGQGIVFGQSMNPSNDYSIYRQYANYGTLARRYANSGGYITFDGGSQKALKFRIFSNSRAHASAFYLQRGSNNITIQNCLVENGTSAFAGNTVLPMTSFSPVTGFGFQPDTLLSGSNVFSYSAGIVSRATLMGDNANRSRIDTLPNKNNLIKNNEINGFGYGVVSLGYGQVLMENEGDYKRFYNINNEYSNNTIYNCTRAGMYFGYEENSKILNNKIFNIGNNNIAAAGIMVGGDMTRDFKGYNAVGLELSGNEISGVNSSSEVSGIRVKQSRNVFPHPTKTQVYFPDVAEAMTLTNNVVWGLTTNNGGAERYGIHLFTERTTTGGTTWATLNTPFDKDYLTRNDRVVNNTILIGANGGLISTGAVAAIATQQSKGAYIRNNAIALTDIGVDVSAPVHAAIFYQGPMPKDGGINSDRNVYWVGSNVTGTFARFIELDSKNNVIDYWDRDAFKTLTQWRTWTNQDQTSILANFTNDLTYIGAEPNQKLRINLVPLAPKGSYLNNRGEILSWVTKDIDGNTRGQAGQRYDIGASEFTGRMYISDVEMLDITYPTAYKANVGTYADAEYFMTKAPVNVKVNVRNNGNLQQSQIPVQVQIYRELPNGSYSTTPEVNKSVLIDIASTETFETNFKLDQVGGFVPKTYGSLRGQGYYIPDQFVTMEANVTPKYKIVCSLGSDEQNNNNISQRILRFYIQKSNMRILLSTEHSMVNPDAGSGSDIVAGRLNYDTLKMGMKRLGWFINIDSSRYDYDIFDRFGWETKAANYRDYRTVIWADGSDKPLSRLERMDIRNFLDMGTQIEKKNIIIGSQGYVRQNSLVGANQDSTFLKEIFRAISTAPENPLGVNGNYSGNFVVGMACERDLSEKVIATSNALDVANPPNCGLMKLSPTGEGLALPAYYYKTKTAGLKDSIMGIGTSTLTRNVLVYGVDWRHWSNISVIIRGFIDYIEKNCGTIIPVELLDFNAVAAGNRVDINWATASEYKSDRFEVERATINQTGKSTFSKIAELNAAGNSSFVTKYGPVVDNNVEYGNKYAYRLKMVDLSGLWKYSNEVEVAIDATGNWLGVVTPNPATSANAKFVYSLQADANVALGLYDLSGKKVLDIFNGNEVAGSHDASVNISNLTNGVYTVVLNVNGQTYTRQMNIAK